MELDETLSAENEELDRDRLTAFLRQRLPVAEDLRLSEITVATEGVSREHYRFDLRWSEDGRRQKRALILIRDGKRPAQTDRGVEFRLLEALAGTTIPVPRVYWCDPEGEWLERPFLVMERVEGTVTPTFELPYGEEPEMRQRLGERFVDILGDLHLLDWEAPELSFLERPSGATADHARDVATLCESLLRAPVVERSPVLERALAWCGARVPMTRRLAVCHGDYKLDNLIHRDGEVMAVIDWERARIGDPMMDLAYVCAPHLRVGELATGLLEPERVVERYAERTGYEIEPGALAFWQVNLLLQTVFYFSALSADAAQRGGDLRDQTGPYIERLLSLVEESIDS